MADIETTNAPTTPATPAEPTDHINLSTGTGTGYDDVRETIRNEVYDPELGLNIVDLGLLYDITVEQNKVDITMTLTSPGCPVGPELITNVRRALSRFEDVEEVDIHLVFSPPWHPSMMSEEAKDELGYFG
ncbi:MAG TPA: metal-sulfur cluster assembly factor [Chloroflexia bacterium]|nr:metal-sulfur cluster assembly factor [Chloroflexia bacterium]